MRAPSSRPRTLALAAFAVLGGWLLPANAPALTITLHDAGTRTVDYRGVSASQYQCLERGEPDPVTLDAPCLDSESTVLIDRPPSSQLVVDTSLSPDFAGSPTAFHRSEVGQTSIGGSGGITIGRPPQDFDGTVDITSRFDYGFEIDEAANFTLTALLERPPLDGPIGGGFVWFQFCTFFVFGCGPNNGIADFLLNESPPFELVIVETGILEPGAYLLEIEAGEQSFRSSASSWQFELAFTPVPEPGTGMLMLVGLLVLVAKAGRSSLAPGPRGQPPRAGVDPSPAPGRARGRWSERLPCVLLGRLLRE